MRCFYFYFLSDTIVSTMKKIIAAISCGFVVLASSVVGFSGVLKQKTSVDYSNWMNSVNDLTLIKNMNIPGTHDTMATRSIGDLAGKCQSLTLDEQLKIGVRFLDIRLQLVNNDLKAVHGIVDQKVKFSSIVNTVDSFLTNHPSEFIIMSIKEDEDPSKSTITFDEAINKYKKANWENPITDLSLTTLGAMRGKVLVLSRYKDATVGINAYTGWSDNATFDLPNGIHIQDEYKLKTNDTKIEAIKNCFSYSGASLKINFLSGYLESGFPPSYAPSVANTINPWIKENLKTYPNRGIVLYDFGTSDLMKGWFE